MAGIEILIWEFTSAQRAIGEVMCSENESKSEQNRSTILSPSNGSTSSSPTNRTNKPSLIASQKPGAPKLDMKLALYFIRLPFPLMLLCHQISHS